MKKLICNKCLHEIKPDEDIIIYEGQAGYADFTHSECSCKPDETRMKASEITEEIINDYGLDDLVLVDLPDQVTIDLSDLDIDDDSSYDWVMGEIEEYLANKFGYCVETYHVDIDKDRGIVEVSNIVWDVEG